MARPAVRFSQALADSICCRLAKGETLRQICRSEGMPSDTAVRQWALDESSPFSSQYARARELGYAAMAEELIDIADDGTNDWIEREREDGRIETVVDHDHVARSRLRLDTRKWLLSKALPKVYGDKLQHANAAGDGNTEIIYRWEEKPDV